ncbi:MAG: hypothetical protein F2873_06755, partial [Actinobacteria bacterium]|nr:hypothetical protein [Actinomycetota bacterium]
MPSRRLSARMLAAVVALASISACAVDNPSSNSSAPDPGERVAPIEDLTIVRTHRHDVSPELRNLSQKPPSQEEGASADGDATAAPTKNDGTNKPRKLLRKKIIPHVLGNGVDPAAQTLLIGPLRNARQKGSITGSAAGPVSSSSPTLGAGFDSIGRGYSTFTVNSAPPDTNSAVGPSHVMTIVNSGLTIQTKSGAILYGP